MSKFRFNPDSEKLYENHFTNNLIIAYPKGDGYNYRDINDTRHLVMDSHTMEDEYREIKDGTGFNNALLLLKAGAKVARSGWNGKGMWLELIKAKDYQIHNHDFGPKNEHDHNWKERVPQFLPWIGMKTADNKFVPWLASQTDMLAVDWIIIE